MAFSAIRGQNRNPVYWGVSSVDGVTPVQIAVSSATGGMVMEIGTSVMPVIAVLPASLPRDDNRVTAIGGVSNANSRVIIPVSVNPTNGAVQASI